MIKKNDKDKTKWNNKRYRTTNVFLLAFSEWDTYTWNKMCSIDFVEILNKTITFLKLEFDV